MLCVDVTYSIPEAYTTIQSAPDALAEAAVAACEAIGLSVSGVDLIVADEGGQPVGYVIKLNQCPHIGSHIFPTDGPGQANAFAEAIVDYHFSETIHVRTHPDLDYDFAPICAPLESAQISELPLPVIGPDWKVLRFSETGIAAKAIAKLIEVAANIVVVFVISALCNKGGVQLYLAYTLENSHSILRAISTKIRPDCRTVRYEELPRGDFRNR